MEQQTTENETSVKVDAIAHERDNKHLDIDFSNIEHILDFSVCCSHKAVKNKRLKIGSAMRKIDLRELTCQYPLHIKPGAK